MCCFVFFVVVVHVLKKICIWGCLGARGLANPSFSRIVFLFAKTRKNDLREAVIQCCITVGQPDTSTMI